MRPSGVLSRSTRSLVPVKRATPSPSSLLVQRTPLGRSTCCRASRDRRFYTVRNPASRQFSSSCIAPVRLQPDAEDPAPPAPEATSESSSAAAQLSDSQYHELADQYLDRLVYAAEELSESSEDGTDVEYSAGVLTITLPQKGSYVINKQPPNKQIWLSSPVSGPKRYDWVVSGAGQHEKEGSAVDSGDDGSGGKWVYLRDGSSLSALLKKEVGIEVTHDGGTDAPEGI